MITGPEEERTRMSEHIEREACNAHRGLDCKYVMQSFISFGFSTLRPPKPTSNHSDVVMIHPKAYVVYLSCP